MQQQQQKSAAPPGNKAAEQKIIDDLLGNMPSNDEIPLNLPSHNKFYSLQDPSKPITLRPMTFDDERAMMSNKNINVDVLNILLGRCISNIDVSQLLQMDKLFIIMKLREISYGDDYSAQISCASCRRDNMVKFKLSSLPVRPIEEEMENPRTVHLPVLDKQLKVRLPRISDEQYFSNTERALGNLWRFVEEIEGHSQKSVISKVIPKLPLKDAHVLLEAMSANEYGLDTKVRFLCSYCSHNEIMELPITSDFFTGK